MLHAVTFAQQALWIDLGGESRILRFVSFVSRGLLAE